MITELLLASVVGLWLTALAGLSLLILRARQPHDTGPNLLEDPPTGRHHEDTVEIVPTDYMPLIGRRRIAAETDTQQIYLGER